MEIFDVLDSTLSSIITVLFLLVTLLLTYIYFASLRPKNFPPGPPALPIVGSLPFLSTNPDGYIENFGQLHEKYGDIFSIKMGKV